MNIISKNNLNYVSSKVLVSSKFYYYIAVVLVYHLFIRHFCFKISSINAEPEYSVFIILTAFLYSSVYSALIFSAWLNFKKLNKFYFSVWVIICLISIFNELSFYISFQEEYNFKSSFFFGQGAINIKITLPILFLCVWEALDHAKKNSFKILNLISFLIIVNSFFIIMGFIFDISLFESYPGSKRWGYSGLISKDYAVILTTIILIFKLQKHSINLFKITLLFFSLIVTGTKAGFLSAFLIFLLVVVNKNSVRALMMMPVVFSIYYIKNIMSYIINADSFYLNIYQNHGFWGFMFSTRNEKFEQLISIAMENYKLINLVFGGYVRFEDLFVEMLFVDLFVFYGIAGLTSFMFFFRRLTKNLTTYIPLIVAFFSGVLLHTSLAFIIWGIWCFYERKET